MSTITISASTVLGDLLLHLPAGETALISGVDWPTYELLCDLRDRERKGVRLIYDHGKLEIMSPSFRHEKTSARLADFVKVLAEELNLPLIAGGSTTFRREDLARGLEPDECFYIQHVEQIRHVSEIDLSRDPPPDLVIEVDVSQSSLVKEPIYASLGIPELWHVVENTVTIRILQADERYVTCERSVAIPQIGSADLTRFLTILPGADDIARIRQFRDWVRANLPSRL